MLMYHMNKLESTLPKLLNMLKNVEVNLKKDKGQASMVFSNSSRVKTRRSKSKFKKNKQITKPSKGVLRRKDKAKSKYFHCSKERH